MFDPSNIAFALFSSNLAKLINRVIPFVDKYPMFCAENEKFGYFKHMVLWLETVGDNMRAQRDQLDALELSADFPADVVYAELDSWGAVEQ